MLAAPQVGEARSEPSAQTETKMSVESTELSSHRRNTVHIAVVSDHDQLRHSCRIVHVLNVHVVVIEGVAMRSDYEVVPIG